MALRWIEIENLRAIARGRVAFDEVTVLFGENDSGRSSLLEALTLSLDPGAGPGGRLQPYHFHRTPDGGVGGLRIRVGIDEPGAGAWSPPQRVVGAFPALERPRRLVAELRARLDPVTGVIRVTHRLRSLDRPGMVVQGDATTRDWLWSVVPVLRLRLGEGSDPDDPRLDPALRDLALHHHHLLAGDVPDLEAELDAGARAALAVLERFGSVFAGASAAMSAVAAEILVRRPEAVALPSAGTPSTAAHKLALLLLLGAMLQLARRAAAHGPPAPGSRPVLVVEDPEAGLHPITLASLWRILDRVTWQRIVATNAETIVGGAPLTALRRLQRRAGVLRTWSVAPEALSADAIRKVSYHLRSRRSAAMFARAWILAEGETEFWVLPELARAMGHDLAAEGVACVEFAQCGVAPLLRLADQLGIATVVVVDGDEAGRHYVASARQVVGRGRARREIHRLVEPDIEHCFWAHGFADVITAIALAGPDEIPARPSRVIRRAIERTSKPALALSLVEAVAARGAGSVPPPLRAVIERAIAMARD